MAPLDTAQHAVLSDREPFFAHGEAQLFIAVRDGRDRGRIAAIENRRHNRMWDDRVGFFGFFECEDDTEAAGALLAASEDWLRGRGLAVMRGPVNLSTNHTLGLLVAGEPGPPMIDMTYNPSYYKRLLVRHDLVKAMDLLAHIMDVTGPATVARLEKMARRTESRGNVTERCIDMKYFDRDLAVIKQLYNAAREKNWGFVPLTDKEIDHIARDLKTVIDPGLVRFVFVDGKPAGFIAVVVNINEILIMLKGRLLPFGVFLLLAGRPRIKSLRLMLMGVVREMRRRGLETLLYYRTMRYAIGRGYRVCENSWLLESNEPVLRASEFMGGREYRRYRLYERPIAEARHD